MAVTVPSVPVPRMFAVNVHTMRCPRWTLWEVTPAARASSSDSSSTASSMDSARSILEALVVVTALSCAASSDAFSERWTTSMHRARSAARSVESWSRRCRATRWFRDVMKSMASDAVDSDLVSKAMDHSAGKPFSFQSCTAKSSLGPNVAPRVMRPSTTLLTSKKNILKQWKAGSDSVAMNAGAHMCASNRWMAVAAVKVALTLSPRTSRATIVQALWNHVMHIARSASVRDVNTNCSHRKSTWSSLNRIVGCDTM